MALFANKSFVSHSGIKLPFKIDTDSLSNEDWDTIAEIVTARFKFSRVITIPTGGDELAKRLIPFATGLETDPTLFVDDVMTTGKSFQDFASASGIPYDKRIGVVVFSRMRKPRPGWVHAIFQFWD